MSVTYQYTQADYIAAGRLHLKVPYLTSRVYYIIPKYLQELGLNAAHAFDTLNAVMGKPR